MQDVLGCVSRGDCSLENGLYRFSQVLLTPMESCRNPLICPHLGHECRHRGTNGRIAQVFEAVLDQAEEIGAQVPGGVR